MVELEMMKHPARSKHAARGNHDAGAGKLVELLGFGHRAMKLDVSGKQAASTVLEQNRRAEKLGEATKTLLLDDAELERRTLELLAGDEERRERLRIMGARFDF